MKKTVLAMFITLLAGVPVVWSQSPGLPDPVSFVVRLESGNVGQAKEWLDAGLPPDFMGARIGSGLMIGAWEGNLELMRLFLASGADINRVNTNGESALALAAIKGRLDVVKWLLDRGARLNPKSRQWSALHYAVFSGNKELVDFLIEQGADVDARSTNGSTPLMLAVYEGHENVVRRLIEKGADRKIRNDWNDGALEWAMRYEKLKLARMVSSPEEFNIAIAEPKEKWGIAQRSVRQSSDLETFLKIREELVSRGQNTSKIDQRIFAERTRLLREAVNRTAPARVNTLEITASRTAPNEQSAAIVTDGAADAQKAASTYKVPAKTYVGKPKMPPKAPVKN